MFACNIVPGFIMSPSIWSYILQVLTETDHCYCVLLNAHGGAAFPNKKASQDSSSSDDSSMTVSTDGGKTSKAKVWHVSLLLSESW